MRALVLLMSLLCTSTRAVEYSEQTRDGGQRWGFDAGPGGFHHATATKDNVVRGVFGHKEPRSGQSFRTEYSAGRAGFIPKGPHITRRGDIGLNARLPPGVPIPRPDKAYDFQYRTPSQSRREASDTWGDVRGRYSYVDDVGLRRTVDYVAGRRTGFLVTSDAPDPPVPGSAAEAAFYRPSRPGAPPGPAGTRGYSSSNLAADGSYRFQYSSPDQRRSERKDTFGRVQGEYSFIDDRGQRHRVQYEAGPGIGYRVIKRDSPLGSSPIPPPPSSSYPRPYQSETAQINAASPDNLDESDSSPATLAPPLVQAGRQAVRQRGSTRVWQPSTPRRGTSTTTSTTTEAPDPIDDDSSSTKTGVTLASKPDVTFEAVDFFSDDEQQQESGADNPGDQNSFDINTGAESQRASPWIINIQDPAEVNAQMSAWSQESPPSQFSLPNTAESTDSWRTRQQEQRSEPAAWKRSWTWVAEAEQKIKEAKEKERQKAEAENRPFKIFRDDPDPTKKPSDNSGESGEEDFGESGEEASASYTRGSRHYPVGGDQQEGSPVTSEDLYHLRGRVSSKTPRLAQVISLD